MDWIESIKEIRKAQEKNQLVIFVGAGVSKNSDIPTWSGLIKIIAEEIGYSRCDNCSDRTDDCMLTECEKQYSFTQNEFLRIPEYFYQKDLTNDKSAYYSLIKNTLICDKGPNLIDDEIFRILPHHIITTNYDSLLESSSVVNSKLYTVVSQDSDLLSKASERYIIKMHGDLQFPETIVLKESDYIDYEQKHPLISTFIRSLLINHTFLFLGYSLNDYNLNLIIGWINYFRNSYGVKQRPFNFLLDSKPPSIFEKVRLEDKDIFVIDLSSLPNDLEEKISSPESLSSTTGKKTYYFLKSITDFQLLQNYIPLGEILAEKYHSLKSYKKISMEDLIRVQPLGLTEFSSNELIFHSQEWFTNISKLLTEDNCVVIDTFQRAGISAIHSSMNNEKIDLPVLVNADTEIMRLYLDNNYIELSNLIKTSSDTALKIYFYRLIEKSDIDISYLIEKEASTISNKDYVEIMLHKIRGRFATISLFDRQKEKAKEIESIFKTILETDKGSLGFLKMLSDSTVNNRFKMADLLEKQEMRYDYASNTWYSEHCFVNIWALQAYVYDYYFFFKYNRLPLDNFSDPKNYFSYYLRAIMCSYSPVPSAQPEGIFGVATERKRYPLDEIDFDLLVKFTDPKSLKSWIGKYSVQSIEILDEIDIALKFNNLCFSFIYFKKAEWINQFFCFSIIICLLKIDNDCKKDIFASMVSMFEAVVKDEPALGGKLFETVDYLVKHLIVENANDSKGKLIDAILSINDSKFSEIIKQLSSFATDQTKTSLIKEIEEIEDKSEKCRKIVSTRHVLPLNMYSDFIENNLDLLYENEIFSLIIEKRLAFSNKIFNIFINIIETEDKARKENMGVRIYPDKLSRAIEHCIILILFEFDIDLSMLKSYAHYSKHLQFLLNPNTFDYSYVDTSNYMWQNIIYSQKYKDFFLNHKKELLSDNLKSLFNLGVETKDQQKIVYGLWLESDEVQEFGK